MMVCRFTSDEQRNRLLREWQETSLASMLRSAAADESEREIFVKASLRLRKIQKLLASEYRSDKILRDQLQLMASSIPRIDESFRIKTAESANEAEERIASFLSTESGSANRSSAFYGRDQRFSGRAKKRNFHRRKFSNRSGSFKGKCWVCEKSHLARDHHSRIDIQNALAKKGIPARDSAQLVTGICGPDCSRLAVVQTKDKGSGQLRCPLPPSTPRNLGYGR